jgi:hypothetical protein
MESAPALVPAPAVVTQDRAKPVIIRPPEVSAAHDFAVIGYILTLILSVPWLIISLVIGGVGLAAYLGYLLLPPTLPAYLTGLPFLGPFIAVLVATLSPSYLIYLGFGGGALIIILIFLAIVYFGTARNINKGRYERARNWALLLGVLFLIPPFFVILSPLLSGTIVAILPAFFFMLTYGRLGEVIAKYGPVAVMGEAVPGAPFAGPLGPPPGPMPMPGAPMPSAPMPPMGAPMVPPPFGAGPPMPTVPSGPGGPSTTGVVPKVPLCPTCGRELYYSSNHRRWYCMTCDNPTGHH